jgi:glycosyltransferase involved in cell wall biosynthesis
VDFSDRTSLIAGFSVALARLASDPALFSAYSKAAAERVREKFTWDAKADQMLEIYRWVLGQGTKPLF